VRIVGNGRRVSKVGLFIKSRSNQSYLRVGTGLDSQILGDFEIISKSDRVLHSQNL
jgi:hypothetical protein